MTAVLNAANEMANEMYRTEGGGGSAIAGGAIGFYDIPILIESAMEAHKNDVKTEGVTLDDILMCDAWAREHVRETWGKMKSSRRR
jgi:1-deoxy-D-xylulose-5-phosphate reductoisomerase